MVADDGVNIGNASKRFDSVEWLRTGLSLVRIHLPLLLLTYILLITYITTAIAIYIEGSSDHWLD